MDGKMSKAKKDLAGDHTCAASSIRRSQSNEPILASQSHVVMPVTSPEVDPSCPLIASALSPEGRSQESREQVAGKRVYSGQSSHKAPRQSEVSVCFRFPLLSVRGGPALLCAARLRVVLCCALRACPVLCSPPTL